jgi:hypothetical protein
MKFHIKVRASAIIIENDHILLVEFDDERSMNLRGIQVGLALFAHSV